MSGEVRRQLSNNDNADDYSSRSSVSGEESSEEDLEISPMKRKLSNESAELCYQLPMKNGKTCFLEMRPLLDNLRKDSVANMMVPTGQKNNVYFNLDYGMLSPNLPDDCGAWNEGSQTKTLLIDSDKGVILVYLKNGKYCNLKQENAEKKFVELFPQPNEKNIITLRRDYRKLKGSESYQKRISWLENSTKVCIEYLGTMPPKQVLKDSQVAPMIDGAFDLPKIKDRSHFMDLRTITTLIYNAKNPLNQIPTGRKENVFFLINDESNSQRRTGGLRSQHYDDCGAWKSHGSITHFLDTDDGQRSLVILKDGSYFWSKGKGPTRTFEKVEPQPTENMVMKVHRYYSTSASDISYKRRITQIIDGVVDFKISVVEYLGKFPGLISHGNAKEKNEYERTNPNVMDKISQKCKEDTPKNVYDKLITESEDIDAPRDLKQVQNKKFMDTKKLKLEKGIPAVGTSLADNIQPLLNSVHSDPFIQVFIH